MTTVRFAPSPTGKLHLGSARTAIFNWLYARHTKGKFILRIEDTDLSRSEDIYTESIIRDMKWMGMNFDEFYKQSERFDLYRSFVEKLLEMGKAYYCTCSREDLAARNSAQGADALKYDGHCRGKTVKPEGNYVIRVDIGGERDISFKDYVKNKIMVSTKELDDYVIWKSDGSPTYNFAVVIDDALMKVSHIVRGEDHITNTVKQLILYEYFSFPVPGFAHLPLVLGKDKSPLSKRKGSTNIDYYRSMGILPEALLNAIARLGWSHGNDEIFSMEQLIEFFDLDKLNKSNSVYDEEKMIWVNSKHMKSTSAQKMLPLFEEFLSEAKLTKPGRMSDEKWLLLAIDFLKGRNNTLKMLYDEMERFAGDDYRLEESASAALKALLGDPQMRQAGEEMKQLLLKKASSGGYDDYASLEKDLKPVSEKYNVPFGDLMQLLRIRLTGSTKSPDIIAVMKLLGTETVRRIAA